jgi:uncharacterized membrane protein YfcA
MLTGHCGRGETALAADWTGYIVLFVAGLFAGTLNVLAGGGSFLTLPVLIFLGLPATTANGTNRVGILIQNVGAVWGFRRHGVLDWRWTVRAAVPACLGAVLGTCLALWISDAAFQRLLAFLMVAVTLWTLWDPVNRKEGREGGSRGTGTLLIGASFFVAGVYGGFVQAGVGFLILAATTLAGFDLVRGNAVKVLCILLFTVLSLSIFAWNGHVEWILGLVLGAGTVLGGQIGVRLTVLKGHAWVRGVVTIAVIALALKLWFAA